MVARSGGQCLAERLEREHAFQVYFTVLDGPVRGHMVKEAPARHSQCTSIIEPKANKTTDQAGVLKPKSSNSPPPICFGPSIVNFPAGESTTIRD